MSRPPEPPEEKSNAKKTFITIATIILGGAILIICIQNYRSIPIKLLLWEVEVYLIVLVLATIVLTLLISSLVAARKISKWKKENKKLHQRIATLQEDLHKALQKEKPPKPEV